MVVAEAPPTSERLGRGANRGHVGVGVGVGPPSPSSSADAPAPGSGDGRYLARCSAVGRRRAGADGGACHLTLCVSGRVRGIPALPSLLYTYLHTPSASAPPAARRAVAARTVSSARPVQYAGDIRCAVFIDRHPSWGARRCRVLGLVHSIATSHGGNASIFPLRRRHRRLCAAPARRVRGW